MREEKGAEGQDRRRRPVAECEWQRRANEEDPRVETGGLARAAKVERIEKLNNIATESEFITRCE